MENDNSEYDKKFKEMQSYLPFLDEIIKRLQSKSKEDNQSVRGIQLSKIKSLKNLLCPEKRMKMENLLRCEQILQKLTDKVGTFKNKDMLSVGSSDLCVKDNKASLTEINSIKKPEETVSCTNFYTECDDNSSVNILNTPENSDISISDFLLSRMKLKEITKKDSENKESPPVTKSYEKEIELVTKVYISDKAKINTLSKIINDSLKDGKSKGSQDNISENSDSNSERLRLSHNTKDNSFDRTSVDSYDSKFRGKTYRSRSRDHRRPISRSPRRYKLNHSHSSRSRSSSSHSHSPPRGHGRTYYKHQSGRQNKYNDKATSDVIYKICDSVKSKKKQNDNSIDQLIENEISKTIGDRASISFLKKIRKKLRKEIKLEKEIKNLTKTNDINLNHTSVKEVSAIKTDKPTKDITMPDVVKFIGETLKNIEVPKLAKITDDSELHVENKSITQLINTNIEDKNAQQKIVHSKFEQDVLDALNSEINATDINKSISDNKVFEQNKQLPKKTDKDNENLCTQNVRRISLEKYKEKLTISHNSVQSDVKPILDIIPNPVAEITISHQPIVMRDYFKSEPDSEILVPSISELTSKDNAPPLVIRSPPSLVIQSPLPLVIQSTPPLVIQSPPQSPDINKEDLGEYIKKTSINQLSHSYPAVSEDVVRSRPSLIKEDQINRLNESKKQLNVNMADRFNVNFPVSRNYKGKNPRPQYSSRFSIVEQYKSVNSRGASSPNTYSNNNTNNREKSVYSNADCQKEEKSKPVDKLSTLYANISSRSHNNTHLPFSTNKTGPVFKCESLKELSLHKNSKFKRISPGPGSPLLPIPEVKRALPEVPTCSDTHIQSSNSQDPRVNRNKYQQRGQIDDNVKPSNTKQYDKTKQSNDPRINRYDNSSLSCNNDSDRHRNRRSLEQLVEKKLHKEENINRDRVSSSKIHDKCSDTELKLKSSSYKIPKLKRELTEIKDGKKEDDESKSQSSSRDMKRDDFTKLSGRRSELPKVENQSNVPEKCMVIIDETKTFVVYDEMVTSTTCEIDNKKKDTHEISENSDKKSTPTIKTPPYILEEVDYKIKKDLEIKIEDQMKEPVQTIVEIEHPEEISSNILKLGNDIFSPKNDSTTKEPDKIVNKPPKPIAEVQPVCQTIQSVEPVQTTIPATSLETISEPQDAVTSLLDVLQNKKKMQELLRKGEDLPLKLKRKLELLAELESDDEGEETSIKPDATIENKSYIDTNIEKIDSINKDNLNEDIKCIPSVNEDQLNIISVNVDLENSISMDSTNMDIVDTSQNEVKDKSLDISKTKSKGKSRLRNEVDLLRKALPEVYTNQGGLVTTGIRMCRLAKEFTTEVIEPPRKKRITRISKSPQKKLEKHENVESERLTDKKLVVVVENCAITDKINDSNELPDSGKVSNELINDKDEKIILHSKPCPKSKKKTVLEKSSMDETSNVNIKLTEKLDKPEEIPKQKLTLFRNKPCPKSKKPIFIQEDDSMDIEVKEDETDIETEEKSNPVKNKVGVKRKKRMKWKSGNITKKYSKRLQNLNKKLAIENIYEPRDDKEIDLLNHFAIGSNRKYKCRYCDDYNDEQIVKHYLEVHPNQEVLISRLSPGEAKSAIEQSLNDEIQNKRPNENLLVTNNSYKCRFCNKHYKRLVTFFSHIIMFHTGENILIHETTLENNVLYGYMCEKCNYTQFSKNNVSNHIRLNHADQLCKVYKVNLSNEKFHDNSEEIENYVDDIIKKTQDFPTENGMVSISIDGVFSTSKNTESLSKNLDDLNMQTINSMCELNIKQEDLGNAAVESMDYGHAPIKFEPLTDDVFDIDSAPHIEDNFANNEGLIENNIGEYTVTVGEIIVKIMSSESIEYTCTIKNCSFQTKYFLSFAVHLETLHINDSWNGYCSVCGSSTAQVPDIRTYNQAFVHIINCHIKHNENGTVEIIKKTVNESTLSPMTRINVRPISELLAPISTENHIQDTNELLQPIIESVVSLNPDSVNITMSNDDNGDNLMFDDIQDNVANNISVDSNVECSPMFEQLAALTRLQEFTKIKNVLNGSSPNFFHCIEADCPMSTNSAIEFYYHLEEHSRKIYLDSTQKQRSKWRTCSYCGTVSTDTAQTLLHVINEHGHCKFQCTECTFRSASFIVTFAHSKIMHLSIEDSSRVKEIVPYRDEEPEQFTLGMIAEDKCFQPYICTQGESLTNCCCKTFKTLNTFMAHVTEVHKNRWLFCQFAACRTAKMPLIDLILHLRRSHNFNIYKCAYCNDGADTQTLMLYHLMNHHSSRSPIFYFSYKIDKNEEESIHKINFDDELGYHLKNMFGFSLNGIEDNDIPTEIVDVPDDIQTPSTSFSTEKTLVRVKSKRAEIIDVVDSDEGVQSENDSHRSADSDSNEPVMHDMGKARRTRTKIRGLVGKDLFKCGNKNCDFSCDLYVIFMRHLYECKFKNDRPTCFHCGQHYKHLKSIGQHIFTHSVRRYKCGLCEYGTTHRAKASQHARVMHKLLRSVAVPLDPNKTNHYSDYFIIMKPQTNYVIEKTTKNVIPPTSVAPPKSVTLPESTPEEQIEPKKKDIDKFGPGDIANLPLFPILTNPIYCSVCSFFTKVTSNMLRHLQLHLNDVAAPTAAPINPVPHLQSNEMHFDKMTNLALSSNIDKPRKKPPAKQGISDIPIMIPKKNRFVCGSKNCMYISLNELMLKKHWEILHSGEHVFNCVHCKKDIVDDNLSSKTWFVGDHLQLHGKFLYLCDRCNFMHSSIQVMKNHGSTKHGDESFITLRGDGRDVEGEDKKWTWECTVCLLRVATKKEVTEHCFNIHGTSHLYKCGNCEYSSFTQEKMKEHYISWHPDASHNFFVMYCKRFSNESEMSNSPLWWKQRKRPSHFASMEDDPLLKKAKNAEKPQIVNKIESQQLPKKPAKLVEEEPPIDLDKFFSDDENYPVAPMDTNEEKFSTKEYICPFCSDFATNSEDKLRQHLYKELKYKKTNLLHKERAKCIYLHR